MIDSVLQAVSVVGVDVYNAELRCGWGRANRKYSGSLGKG